MGRWVDMKNDYKTMDTDFMESVWWVFKSIYDKGLIYERNRIVPYCPRCTTPLSNFEVNQGYKDKQSKTVTVKFKRLRELKINIFLLGLLLLGHSIQIFDLLFERILCTLKYSIQQVEIPMYLHQKK